MTELEKEIIVLTPKAVYIKAKELADVGYYEKALELICENKIELTVYNEKLERKRKLR